MSTEAIKFDKEKIRPSLIPAPFIEDLAAVLTFGAKKYGDHNWTRGFKWTRVYDALQRHLLAWFKGEDKDPETGLSHLMHATCNIMFLHTFAKEHPELDDRRKSNQGAINIATRDDGHQLSPIPAGVQTFTVNTPFPEVWNNQKFQPDEITVPLGSLPRWMRDIVIGGPDENI